mmetsp:Transcript_8956/g.20001  ORF Transcript_8956/g.20001 Transcript_8956/m.20001 type:complete len:173 (+) Transcript_8956:143-661(+)
MTLPSISVLYTDPAPTPCAAGTAAGSDLVALTDKAPSQAFRQTFQHVPRRAGGTRTWQEGHVGQESIRGDDAPLSFSVVLPDGQTCRVEAPSEASVEELKELLRSTLTPGLPSTEGFRLLWRGAVLSDERRLRSYRIPAESELRLITHRPQDSSTGSRKPVVTAPRGLLMVP